MTDEETSDGREPDMVVEDAGPKSSSVNDRYQKVFRHSNDAILVVDLETETFVDANPEACRLLGYSRDELRSMQPADIHPQEIKRLRETFFEVVRENGSAFTDELSCVAVDGSEIPTEMSGVLLNAGDGREPTQMIAMVRDISDRIEHRQKLEEKIERLDQFASIVSHDLKNPLSVIEARLTLARETGDGTHFDAIEKAVARMDEMLSELLQLTREGNIVGERTETELETLAREVWEDCGIEPATLDIASSRTVYADRDRLRELFANLFENASTHSGESVTVRVGTFDSADREGFYVEDDGDGIPAEEREAVFEWGHTTTSDGTGFGLAIVAEIVEAHGWEIGVTDSEAGGTRFEIAL